MAEANPRTIKTKQPVGVIIGAVAIGVLLLGGILFAVWESGLGITEARMRGTIVAKEFVPRPEEQITIGEQGLHTSERAGEYQLTVEVLRPNGTREPFTVWLDEARFNAVEIGQSFDVGPYLAPGER